ncbi:uncharacterized protein C3orf20-like isoform X2 [Brachyhypopomus gauderio]|uniref:uncharacterized protein C3orf20-like isoform X2 n=1 Tax=Brachyhypopomus gauderio TaxID=698409 RepID=UPI004041C3B9
MDQKLFQQYVSKAPSLLSAIASMLDECVKQELLLPAGIWNLCALSWEDLTALPSDARPLHRVQGQGHLPCPPPSFSSPSDTRHRIAAVPSNSLLPTEPTLSVRQPATRPSVLSIKKHLPTHHGTNVTFIPVTSTIRLYVEDGLSRLSFSLTYKEISEPSVPHLHRTTLDVCLWAVQKLHLIMEQFDAEQPGSEVVTLHYKDHKPRLLQPTSTFTSDFLFPTIPNTKILNYSTAFKLHYGLPDKTSLVYYPSGAVAVCQVPCADGGGGVYTNVFSDSSHDNLLASFLPNGRGFIYHHGKQRSSGFALLVHPGGGQGWSREGRLTKEWAFSLTKQCEVQHQYKQVSNEVMCRDEINTFMAALQCIRRRVKNISLCWLNLYLTAAGLADKLSVSDSNARLAKYKEAWNISSKVQDIPQTYVRPMPFKKKVDCPTARSLPMRRISSAPSPTFHRIRMARLPDQHYSMTPTLGKASHSPCPAVLRLVALNMWEEQSCHCSMRLPLVTDLELDVFLQSSKTVQSQTLVLYVMSSLHPTITSQRVEAELQRLHHQQVYQSSTPCIKSSKNLFRLVKYDIDTATRHTHTEQPLLVRRHNVGPGTVLMYMGGKMVYGGYTLNGYGISKINLLKHIAKAQSDFAKGITLPDDYKLGAPPQMWGSQDDYLSPGHMDRHPDNREKKSTKCYRLRKNSRDLKRLGGLSGLECVISNMSDVSAILAIKNNKDAHTKPVTC